MQKPLPVLTFFMLLMAACGSTSREKQTIAMLIEEKYYQTKTAFFYRKWGASFLADKYAYKPSTTATDSVGFTPLYYSPELFVSSEPIYAHTVPMGVQYKLPVANSTVFIDAGTYFAITTTLNHPYLQINGEAYLQTGPHEKIKIDAGDCVIWCDGGTELNINNYADEPYSSISLVKGSGTITRCGTKTIINTPGKEILLYKGNGIVKERIVAPAEIKAWVDGRLRSQQVSLIYQLRQLSRWFNKSINYRGNLLTEAKKQSLNYRETTLTELLNQYHLAYPNYGFNQLGESIYVRNQK